MNPAQRAVAVGPPRIRAVRRRRHRRRRGGAGGALDAATRGLRSRWWRRATSRRARRVVSSKMFTAGCATSNSSSSVWCARRCTNANCPDDARAASGQTAAVSVPAHQPVVERPHIRRRRHLPLRPAGRIEISSGAKHLTRAGALRLAPDSSEPRWSAASLLRHRRRRRPAHHDGRPDRGALRRGGAHPRHRWSRCCGRATGWSGCASARIPRTAR